MNRETMLYELITERLVLRSLDERTLLNLSRSIMDGPTLKGLRVPKGWPMDVLLDALPVMFNDLSDAPSSFGWHAWVVADKATGEVLGDAGFKGPPDETGAVEMGFSILPEHRGRGYAKEAVRALLDHAFASGRVRTIIAECEEGNLASSRALTGSGFEIEMKRGNRAYYTRKV